MSAPSSAALQMELDAVVAPATSWLLRRGLRGRYADEKINLWLCIPRRQRPKQLAIQTINSYCPLYL